MIWLNILLITFQVSFSMSAWEMQKDIICHSGEQVSGEIMGTEMNSQCKLVILGAVQDGGSPHTGCNKACCSALFLQPDRDRRVVSLGLIDEIAERNWLIEATPDLPVQMKDLHRISGFDHPETPDGIIITHAHIGHYTGLMFLGREVMGSQNVPVYVMPRMASFLEQNGPWDQLISLKNIQIQRLEQGHIYPLSAQIKIEALLVPHRDEYSETAGFIIHGPSKKILFIPDIDKWNAWDQSIVSLVKRVDYAFLDATFYDQHETPNRDMSEIPHPYVVESMALFESLEAKEKAKIHFIHMNHTNPLLDENSAATKEVIRAGFGIARRGMSLEL